MTDPPLVQHKGSEHWIRLRQQTSRVLPKQSCFLRFFPPPGMQHASFQVPANLTKMHMKFIEWIHGFQIKAVLEKYREYSKVTEQNKEKPSNSCKLVEKWRGDKHNIELTGYFSLLLMRLTLTADLLSAGSSSFGHSDFLILCIETW